MAVAKVSWHGEVVGVQPRIRLLRSFDQGSHTYLGYALRIRGEIDGASRDFLVGIGPEAHAKHQFRVGDVASGECMPVVDPRLEIVEFYKASGLRVEHRPVDVPAAAPPWLGVAPQLEVYRARGHRRLDIGTYEGRCTSCIWGSYMAVEMIVDQWKPHLRRYRSETFCYGPKSCRTYRAGPKRVVPGRKGMKYVEEDWVDEEATRHRAPEE